MDSSWIHHHGFDAAAFLHMMSSRNLHSASLCMHVVF
jgi:hypothetical protein